MKNILVFIFVICAAGTIYLTLYQKKPEPYPNPPHPDPGVIPHQPGVLPKEKEVLDWLETNGCNVEILVSYKFDNEPGKPYDKLYSISWVYTVSGLNDTYSSFSETHGWDSFQNTHEDLIKIKDIIEKQKRTGIVTKPGVSITTR